MKKVNRDNKIEKAELKKMSEKMFDGLVKAVVDMENKIMVVDAGLHSDQEKYLIERGSKQENLWGINLYPNKNKEEFIEFDSMINLRPRNNNRSRGVEDPKIREKIKVIVSQLIEK